MEQNTDKKMSNDKELIINFSIIFPAKPAFATYAKAGLALRKLQHINHVRGYTDTMRNFQSASISTGLYYKYAETIAIKHVSKEAIKKLL